MPGLSIFNDILGPIMIGPSSSHTAGPARIGRMARDILGDSPRWARLTFDPEGSFARTFRTQKSDCGFVAGLLGMSIDDLRLKESLEIAAEQGVTAEFSVEKLAGADHPNTVRIEMRSESGQTAEVWGKSIGGGMVVIDRANGCPVQLTGGSYELLAGTESGADLDRAGREIASHLGRSGLWDGRLSWTQGRSGGLVNAKLSRDVPEELKRTVADLPGVTLVRVVRPVLPVVDRPGHQPLFRSPADALELAACANSGDGLSLGELARRYEAGRTGLGREQLLEMMGRVRDVMWASAEKGLEPGAKLSGGIFDPAAPAVERARRVGRLISGGPVGRAVVLSLAVMEVSNSLGVICAAPTAGSAGIIPGVLKALTEERDLPGEVVLKALFAAGGAGLIIARFGTFAAEVAGCQAECGAASAMAAAALVDAAGGGAAQALDAASVALQNVLGLVCDPVAGFVQVPCFGKNAMGVANAFAAADMVLGGYENKFPLDEVAGAMLQIGRGMPAEVRCTALGGLAATPSARKLQEKLQEKRHQKR